MDPVPTNSLSNSDNSPLNHQYTLPVPNVDNDNPEIDSSPTESNNIPLNHQHTSSLSNINNSNGNHQPTKETDISAAYETNLHKFISYLKSKSQGKVHLMRSQQLESLLAKNVIML